MNKHDMAAMIDHTIPKPKATQADVARIVEESAAAGTFSVCMPLSMLPLDVPEESQVAYVVGFLSGAVKPEVKTFEAVLTVADGADEIDMAVNIELVRDGRLADLKGKAAAVRRIVPSSRVLEVIVEATALTDDEIVAVYRASMAASADFVKTSVGSHPAGGASTHTVALTHITVGEALGVKASGDVHDAETILAMVKAEASRLGTSATNAILTRLEDWSDGAARTRPPVDEPRPEPRDGLSSELQH